VPALKKLKDGKRERRQTKIAFFYYWDSPHAGQVFCALGILAPHSTQYFIVAAAAVVAAVVAVALAVAALSADMPTDDDDGGV
jgi:hypothetical protein